ncbi:MAG: Uma2 family endonuclease [Planctomycetaceae bacterium]
MSANAAVPATFSEFLEDLGQIPPDRVRKDPLPGQATLDDLIGANHNGGLCELVDGTLVEKAMGWQESVIAMYLGRLMSDFVVSRNLGFISGADGFVQLFPDLVRGPDVAYFSWQRLPNQQLPATPVPPIVPNIAVEVISISNTRSEMIRKNREYFRAGVTQVWMVDPRERTVAVYTSATSYRILNEDQILTGGDILPGLEIRLADVFGELDRQPESH